MPLNELRQARGLSQKMLAEVLHVQQPSIAKMEKPTDMYLSTLCSHIEAMGGRLEVVCALSGWLGQNPQFLCNWLAHNSITNAVD